MPSRDSRLLIFLVPFLCVPFAACNNDDDDDNPAPGLQEEFGAIMERGQEVPAP
jgi:hypothetical protein